MVPSSGGRSITSMAPEPERSPMVTGRISAVHAQIATQLDVKALLAPPLGAGGFGRLGAGCAHRRQSRKSRLRSV